MVRVFTVQGRGEKFQFKAENGSEEAFIAMWERYRRPDFEPPTGPETGGTELAQDDFSASESTSS